MCCACQNQTSSALNLAAVTPKKPAVNLASMRLHGACYDNATETDSAGDGCEWYEGDNSLFCGAFDRSDLSFVAGRDCCACSGGRNATDSYGDGCEWYVTFPHVCGNFDDDDFRAKEMCQACSTNALILQGAKGPKAAMVLQAHNRGQVAPLSLSGVKKIPLSMHNPLCTDDTSSNDSFGDSCSWYYGNEGSCGVYDTDSFIAAKQCCACGRPNDPPAPVCTDDLSTVDSGFDSCTWYYDNVASCGSYDSDTFNAAT